MDQSGRCMMGNVVSYLGYRSAFRQTCNSGMAAARKTGDCSKYLDLGTTVILLKMDVKHIKDYLSWLYYQYLLITCSYVLEPWEQSIFNTVLLTAIAMVIYSSYVFIPIHVRLAVEYFSGIFGGQHESTVAPMS
ncbi:serine palmitoyltransferase small subunit B isoform X1 [Dendropsophus ebraccatus]|uniref:serine palmitoyltransferase small subunit B isoform X1 n=2 Tax=Dendropsophus ebraccatus TaxID=150705 RepID=UPI0038311B2F